jgi:MarR family transcriptional regulator, organic hydroperoxide resistance regulator
MHTIIRIFRPTFNNMKPEETVDFHIRWTWSKISRLYNIEAARHGGSMSIGYILLNIDKEGTPSTKLGPKMGMEARSLTRSLKLMEENGLIIRQPDPIDRRMARVFLTDEGQRMREVSKNVVIRFNERVREVVSETELKSMFSTLQKINQIIELNNIFQITAHETKH